MKATINTWPWSQICAECSHGSLIIDTDNFGSSAYCCEIEKDITGTGECAQLNSTE